MTNFPDWPPYSIGPHESIFAMGVISVNYVRLEFAAHQIFSTILGINSPLSDLLMYKLSNEARVKLVYEMLPSRKWPTEITERVSHFVQAFKICYENRNHVMHSDIFRTLSDAHVLIKTGRDGKATLYNRPLSDLRKVADDMDIYADYGLILSNRVSLCTSEQPHSVPWPLPSKPPLPIPMEYTSGPTPLQSLR